jgi:hypothetical protein
LNHLNQTKKGGRANEKGKEFFIGSGIGGEFGVSFMGGKSRLSSKS